MVILPKKKDIFSMTNKLIKENLKIIVKKLPVVNIHFYQGILSITVPMNRLVSTLSILKNHINFQFKVLSCISGVDYPNKKRRFKIVYELLSLKYNTRLRVKVFVDELTPIKSSISVYPAAGWYESEIWDMFGVFFVDHSNLTRLLTDYGFEGYPLRKDFPLSGFIETSYDYNKKQVLNSKIELSQEYKSFNFKSSWEDLKL